MTLSDSAVKLGDTVLSLADVLRGEHRRGRLARLLRRAAEETCLLEHARQRGLHVSDEELQNTADQFRRSRRLLTADETRRWLSHRRLTVDDLELVLESRLLVGKLRQHIVAAQAEAWFTSHRADYDRMRLTIALVSRDDLASEILTQVSDDGVDLAALAAQHSLHESRSRGGRIGPTFRASLSATVRSVLPGAIGELAGPLATPEGFLVLRVDEIVPAELDPPTRAAVGEAVFTDWLRRTIAPLPLESPLLDSLASFGGA